MNNNKIVDVMVNDGLWDAFNQYHMGITAENVAEKYGITREMQDEFAVASQSKAEAAVKGGKFKDEIVPVVIHGKKGDTVFDTDEYPKFGTTLEKVAKLKPAFKKRRRYSYSSECFRYQRQCCSICCDEPGKSRRTWPETNGNHRFLCNRRCRSIYHGCWSGACC